MLSKFILVLMSFYFTVSSAEVKTIGTVVASRCGNNQIKASGPGVTSVCFAAVVGVSDKSYLTATIQGGTKQGTYIYQYTKRVTFAPECIHSGAGISCQKTYQLIGKVDAQNKIQPFANTAVVTTLISTIETGHSYVVKSDDILGSSFYTNAMQVVLQTQ